MTSLQNKYKDDLPENTIKKIQNFFKQRNCAIKIGKTFNNNQKVFSCSLMLYFNNIPILTSNGKGTSELFALASGHAELYERFCSAPHLFMSNILIQNKLYNNIDKQEITFDNYKDNIYHQKFFEVYLPNDNNLDNFLKLKKFYFNDKLFGDKYISLSNPNNYMYYNTQIIGKILGTNGLATGNTLEEALVQGISEIFERYVLRLFYTNYQAKYYYLDPTILPSYLQDIITSIESQNYKIYIYDLSYTFNLPVCMVLLQDIKHHCYHNIFGAHPNIYIAIERCFTEIYQGYNVLPTTSKLTLPIAQVNPYYVIRNSFQKSQNDINILPEFIIDSNNEKINTYNTAIFTNNIDIDNKDLLKQLLNIANMHKLELFYTNLSLTNDLYVVHIVPNKLINSFGILDNQKKLSFGDQQLIFELFIYLLKNINKFKDKKDTFTIDEIYHFILWIKINLITICENNQEHMEECLEYLFYSLNFDFFRPLSCTNRVSNKFIYDNYEIFKSIILDNFTLVPNSTAEFHKKAEPFYLYYLYLQDSNKTKDQIKSYIEFLGYNTDFIDKYNKLTSPILLKEIFIDEMVNVYNNSEIYKEFIKLFEKREILN